MACWRQPLIGALVVLLIVGSSAIIEKINDIFDRSKSKQGTSPMDAHAQQKQAKTMPKYMQNRAVANAKARKAPPDFDDKKEYRSDQSAGKKLYWTNDHDGLTSQFIQVKMKYIIASKFQRVLVLPPVESEHFLGNNISMCDVFDLPNDIECINGSFDNVSLNGEPAGTARCLATLNVTVLESDRNVCYRDNIPFLGQEMRKNAILYTLEQPGFKCRVNPKYHRDIAAFNAALGIEPGVTSYTAVHWRRGDQVKRCRSKLDQSVNCDTAEAFVAEVRRQSSDEIIYVATNAKSDSPEVQVLRDAGFKTLADGMKEIDPDPVGLKDFAIDMSLMMNATKFLSFGVSEINDLVDYERKVNGLSWCVTKEENIHVHHTFCNKMIKSLHDSGNEGINRKATATFIPS